MEVNEYLSQINVIKRWLPTISVEDKLILIKILNGKDDTIGIPMIREYLKLLKPYFDIIGLTGDGELREPDSLASGMIFFYGCLVYIMHFENWGQYILDIFLYDVLYILVDHYIDDIKISTETKDLAIKQLHIIINDPSSHHNMEMVDPVLKTIAITLETLVTRRPKTKNSIAHIFNAEIRGLAIQNNDMLPRESYHAIARDKGGYTMMVLCDIVGVDDPEILKDTYEIGVIMQLLDDSVDIMADKKNNIHTIATHDIDHYNSLDYLWLDMVSRIGNLSKRFVIFKILYAIFAVYLPDRLPGCYSILLRSETHQLNLFDYTYGCDGSQMLITCLSVEAQKI